MIILAVTVVHNHGHVNGCTTNCSAVQCKRQNLLLTHASYAALLCAAMMCAAISLEARGCTVGDCIYTAGASEAAPSNNGFGCMMLSETHTGTRAALSLHDVGIVLIAL